MAKLELKPPAGLDRAMLAGALRHAMALGTVYRDMHGHVLTDEQEVLAALSRDQTVTSSCGCE